MLTQKPRITDTEIIGPCSNSGFLTPCLSALNLSFSLCWSFMKDFVRAQGKWGFKGSDSSCLKYVDLLNIYLLKRCMTLEVAWLCEMSSLYQSHLPWFHLSWNLYSGLCLALTSEGHPAFSGGNDERQPEVSQFCCHLFVRNILLAWCHLFLSIG